MAPVSCPICSKVFTRKGNMKQHIRLVHHQVKGYRCPICDRPFKRNYEMKSHVLSHSGVRSQHPLPSSTLIDEPSLKKQKLVSEISFREKHISRFRKVRCYTLSTASTFQDLWTLYRKTKEAFKNLLLTLLNELQMLKFDLILHINFRKVTDSNETISCYFHSTTKRVSSHRQLSSQILESFKALTNQVEQYLERGSGWIIETIENLDVNVVQYHPLRGSSYLPLPAKLSNRKAIVNIRNDDNRCFLWSVLAALYPVDIKRHPQRVSHYRQHASSLNLEGTTFPVPIDDVAAFERLNNLSINVYGYTNDDDEISVLHLTENPHATIKISLLLYNHQHYCWIRNPERLLRIHNTNHKQFQCHKCLVLFRCINRRDNHTEKCGVQTTDECEMPEHNQFQFSNFHKMQRLPYALYADFECLLEKTDTCIPSNTKSHTTVYQKHTPCGYGVAEVLGCCSDNVKLGETRVYRGEGAVEKFLEVAILWGERYQTKYNAQVPIEMTHEDGLHFGTTSTCNICSKLLGVDRVADHCHFCGAYRGACHSSCNLKYRLSRDVVVIFHNLRRYDGHLLLEKLGEVASKRRGVKIKVIPKGINDYLTFSLRLRFDKISWHLRFIDSFQFLSAPLAKLVDNLHDKGSDRFELLSSRFSQQQLPLLLRKGVYPYDYMDCWSRFDEQTLPPQEKFKSILTGEDIEDKDYHHAKEVWNQFQISNLGQYHDLYLITDVLLLADVFENFRLFCLYNYQLDPAHYFTAPSFSWDACLKYTGVQMELLTDPEMYKFLESGIRGGISTITHRYAKANNHYLPDFDPSLPSSYIMYIDANNLYGNSMIFPLPLKEFHWIDPASIDIVNVRDDGEEGYILEVDIEYPRELHDPHNDYPLAVERLPVTDDMLSAYCTKLKESIFVTSANVKKLIPNLCNKEKYIVHYRNLKLYLSLGLKLKTIHRILAFKQEAWMAPYIQFNTEMRKKATSSFEKDMFKLFNNSVFGKTMENVRKYIDVKLVCAEDKVVKLASQMEYNGFKVLSDSLYAVKMKRATIKLNKPIYVGFSVLDLSKYIMYNFHHNYITPKYGANARLLFTDTDSLCYHVCTNDIYADMHVDSRQFDFSDYPTNHFCHDVTNKKVMGKFKDELNGVPVIEFVGLRAKMYSLLDVTGNEKKRAKGVKRTVVAHHIKHEMYKDVLFDGSVLKHNMNFIRADAYCITTVMQNKTSLSAFDDKRYITDDGYTSYAYGHYKIHKYGNV